MDHNPDGHVATYPPAPAVEPELKLTYPWQRQMLKLAMALWASMQSMDGKHKQTVLLTVMFHPDGCVTYFSSKQDGKVCP